MQNRWQKIIRSTGIIILALMTALPFGCSDPAGLDDDAEATSNLVAVYISQTPPPMDDPRDEIWDNAITGEIHIGDDTAYTNFFGSGTLSLKAIATDDSLYIRAEWVDFSRSIFPNIIENLETTTYITISDDPLVIDTIVDTVWVQNPSFAVVPGDVGFDTIRNDQDRLAIMWDMGDSGTDSADCAVMCHVTTPSPTGNLMYTNSGTVDIWQWMAALSDPILKAHDEYMDIDGNQSDAFIDLFGINNFDTITGYPISSHRDTSSYSGSALFSEDTIAFDTNSSWPIGYDMPGHILNRNPSGSHADINGFSTYVQSSLFGNRWVVLMSRALTTGNIDDIDFSGLVSGGGQVMATIAVMNNSNRLHSGSQPFYFVFP